MIRQRTTWRTAGAPPAMPMDLQGHPNAQPDPGPDAYKNGDPSSWAEDPDPGPHSPVPPPSMPREAALARQATLRRAAKCVKLAEYMLGQSASEQQIESQALAMMDWDEGAVDTSLNNLGQSIDLDPMAPDFIDDGEGEFDALDFDALDLDDDLAIEPLEWDAAPYDDNQFDALDLDNSDSLSFDEFDDFDADGVLAAMEAEEAEKADDEAKLAAMEAEEAEKEADAKTAALEARLSNLERNLSRVASILAKMAGESDEEEDKAEDKDEPESEEEPEAEDEGKTAGEDAPEEEAPEEEADEGKAAAFEINFDAPVDPMSMIAGDNSLQALYGKSAADEADEEAQKQAARVAGQRAVKASQAPKPVKTLGNVRVASQGNSLESLWKSDPDLSEYF